MMVARNVSSIGIPPAEKRKARIAAGLSRKSWSAPPNGPDREILEVEVEADLAEVAVRAPLVLVLGLEAQVVGNGEFGTNTERNEAAGTRIPANTGQTVDERLVGNQEAETTMTFDGPGRIRLPREVAFDTSEQRL